MREDASSYTPLVSVIINCYNGETYLKEAIDSVYAQSYKNWEIIFWDNASTDGSAEIAHSYDSWLKYFRGEQTIPLGAARNRAVQRANGDLIALLDCDDLWLEDTLEKYVKAMADKSYALCYGGLIRINEAGNQIGTYIPKNKSGHLFNELLMQFDIWTAATMLRKSALVESNLDFDDNVTASDGYCLCMQLAVDYPFCVLPEPIMKYRVRSNSLTNTSIAKWAKEREYTLNVICRKHPGILEKYPSGFREAYARANYYRARYYVSQGEKAKARRELRKSSFVDYRYLILFVLLWLPAFIWNALHRWRAGGEAHD